MSKQSDLVGFSQGELTSAGRVGVNNGDMFISGTAHGIKFDEIDAGTMYLRPCDETGVNENGQIDLGQGGNAFRDAYLTGGLYFSPHSYPANYLDDYEEGTWTPTVTGETNGASMGLSGASGSYVKIGRMVTVNGFVSISSAGSASGTLQFSSLPFQVANTVGSTSIEASGSVSFYDSLSTAVNSLVVNAIESTSSLRLFGQTSSTQTSNQGITVTQVGSSNANFRFSCTYFTS